MKFVQNAEPTKITPQSAMTNLYKKSYTHPNKANKRHHPPPKTPNTPKSPKGLSNSLYLVARSYNNSETQLFTIQNGTNKKPNKPDNRTNIDKIGDRIQNGLTSRGKKTIRIISDSYQRFIEDENFYNQRHIEDEAYHKYNLFITLTFRNIIPSDKEAKKLLDHYLQRLRRKKSKEGRHDIHYIWVAERQKRGVIHFHLMTPEKLSDNEDMKYRKLEENIWTNRHWNEVVLNWAYKTKKISHSESKQWKSELRLNENYNIKLNAFRCGHSATKPTRPPKSKFLLTPNSGHTFNAGAYMAKYMSKENQNIIGGMYGASTLSRELLTPQMRLNKEVINSIESNAIVHYIHGRMKGENIYCSLYHIEWNDTYCLWCKRPYKMMEFYFDYIHKYGLGMESTHPKLNFNSAKVSERTETFRNNCFETVSKLAINELIIET